MATLSRRQLERESRRQKPRRRAASSRPKTRGECFAAPRPCPYVSCRYHLLSEVRSSGSLHLPQGDVAEALDAAPETCALDVAAEGPLALDQVGALLNITAEAVRQVEVVALDKLASACTPSGALEMSDTLYARAPDTEVADHLGAKPWTRALRAVRTTS